MSKHPVIHFEMPYEDADRVAKFYETAFGWKMNNWGKDMGDYITAETAKTKEGRPTEPGTINGGLFPKSNDGPTLYPSIVLYVDDIDEAVNKVKAAGGKVLGEPIDIPGVGMYVSFLDTEGNRSSLLQPSSM